MLTRDSNEIESYFWVHVSRITAIAPFGDAYEKIGTIQRRLAWPLHKDDTLFQSGRPTGLNIYFSFRETHEKIGTIQRTPPWLLHKDDTLFQIGRGRLMGLNI